MSRLFADIHRKAEGFELDVLIESDAGRIGILGASGSGKSMTLRSIAGIGDVDSGRIELNGRLIYDSAGKICLRPQQRNVGYMFQNYALFPTMNVLRNVMAGLRGKPSVNRGKAMEMLARFGLDGLEKRLPGELSGGQQQRVALARIMVTEPDVILLDEPFSALDGHLRDRMQAELTEMLRDYRGQVLMVSHNRDELYRFSEELFVLKDGRILRHDRTSEVFRDPRNIEAARLTGCRSFTDAEVIDEHTADALTWGVRLHCGREIPANIRHIGYGSRYFEPLWGERQENCIRFVPLRVDDLPFERNYYILPERNQPDPRTDAGLDYDGMLCWLVQGEERKLIEERGMPDFLKMKEEHLLFLE